MIQHNIQWITPEFCIPPHKVARPEQVSDLAEEFSVNGWGAGYPALVGYMLGEHTVQLLSGSHRWAAAIIANLQKIPVSIIDYKLVDKHWGNLEAWAVIMTPPFVE